MSELSTMDAIAAQAIKMKILHDGLADKCKSFADLHEHVDANDYILEAIGYDETDEWLERVNVIEENVTEWLSTRQALVQSLPDFDRGKQDGIQWAKDQVDLGTTLNVSGTRDYKYGFRVGVSVVRSEIASA